MIIFDLCSFERPSVQASKRSSVQAFKRSSVQAFKRSSAEAFKRQSVQAFKQTFKRSSVQAFKRSSIQAFKRSSVQAFPDVLPETMKRFDYPRFEFQLSRIIWGVRISNSGFTEELFEGFEFRITDSRRIYLSALRISN
jgi:hypothetical protein